MKRKRVEKQLPKKKTIPRWRAIGEALREWWTNLGPLLKSRTLRPIPLAVRIPIDRQRKK